jgi:HK97 gp10 family phage protein
MLIRNAAVKKIMNGPKTGIVYTDGNISHRASAPGQAPANDLGNLQSSINIVAATPARRCEAQVLARAPYAQWLEFGTTKMNARPFLAPSAAENARKCQQILKDELEAASA